MLLCCLLLSVIAMPVSASAAKKNKKGISQNQRKTNTIKATRTNPKKTSTNSKNTQQTKTKKQKKHFKQKNS